MKTLSDIILEKLKVSTNNTDTSRFNIDDIYSFYKPVKLSEFLNYISFDEFEFTQYIDNFNDIYVSKTFADAFNTYDNNFEDNLISFINMLLDIAQNYTDIDSFIDETRLLSDKINKQTEPRGFCVNIKATSFGHSDGSDLIIRIYVELTENQKNRFDSLSLKFHKK